MDLGKFLFSWDVKVKDTILSHVPAVGNGSHTVVEMLIVVFEDG